MAVSVPVHICNYVYSDNMRNFIIVCRLRRGGILFAILTQLETKSVSPVGFCTDEKT